MVLDAPFVLELAVGERARTAAGTAPERCLLSAMLLEGGLLGYPEGASGAPLCP